MISHWRTTPLLTNSLIESTKEIQMITLGVVLLILGFLFKISILWTIGVVLVVIGGVLWLLGALGHAVGGRRHYY